MPFDVSESSPDRNALLLEESFQDATPGMKVSDSALQYSSAFTVSGELMTTLSSLSPVACPSAKPAVVLLAFSALHISRKPGKSFGNSLKPALSVADLR